ncbi:hypothetical protein B0A55_04252 [Friedmanniomyces simplex]|uniref:Ferric oxidoreductase domain-containing protein n=1 Tax=Friedmanniomyces simplex TaxID=329884 RepID=A0A4U0XPE3_9PEZI|nr:hypothetical protein B0A55_04252 [Friedmanniomyces simplex]
MIGSRTRTRARLWLHDTTSVASPGILARLPVTDQLAWIGVNKPAKVFKPWRRSHSWSSLSSNSTLLDDDKDDEIDDEELFGDFHEDYTDFIATHEQLQALQARWLMALVFLLSIAVMATMISLHAAKRASVTYQQAATATGASLLAAVLMRQEHVINLIYHLTCALPQRTPLGVRKLAAKLTYNNGGVHAGSAVSALLWYVAYAVLVNRQFHGSTAQVSAVSAITAAIIVLFVGLIALSHPSIRRHYHNQWELTHRYAQTFLLAIADARASHRPLGKILLHLPTFWFLLLLTTCLIYPWLRLRRLPVHTTRLSAHATHLHFPTRRRLPPAVPGYNILVSNAGDFTRALIHNPPARTWLRGAPTTGVMRLSSLFAPLVIVATGSGIGPCLSFLNLNHGHPMRILWSARCPEKTYGHGVLRDVLRADRNAVVVDTGAVVGGGRVNLVGLAFALAAETGAEGVMVISNPRVTKEVVCGMERRGIAAFGAVFDS